MHRQLDRRQRDQPARGLADRLGGRVVGVVTGPAACRSSACSRSGIVSGTLPSSGTSSSSASSLAAALAEDREALAGGRREAGHVLDHAGDLEVDLVGHLGRAARDLLRGRLRRGDDQELAPAAAAGRASSRRRRCRAAGRSAGSRARPSRRPPGTAVSALWSIGPRHTTAASSSTKKPIDITFTPCASSGTILRSAVDLRALGAEAEHARDRVAPHVGVEHARPACPRRPARRRGWRSASTCRRRPCPSRRRSTFATWASAPSGSAAAAELAAGARAFSLVGQHVEADVDAR